MEHGVAAHHDGGVDVRRRRIDDAHAGGHEGVEGARPQQPLQRRELAPVVDAGYLERVRHAHGLDPAAAARELRDHVRQVDLALRVGRRGPGHGLERRPQPGRVEAVDAGVALAAAALGGRRVALLDDRPHAAVPTAPDTPVPGRIGRQERQDGRGRAAARWRARSASRVGAREQRHVAVEQAGARWPTPAPPAAPGEGHLPCPAAPAARRSAARGRRAPVRTAVGARGPRRPRSPRRRPPARGRPDSAPAAGRPGGAGSWAGPTACACPRPRRGRPPRSRAGRPRPGAAASRR